MSCACQTNANMRYDSTTVSDSTALLSPQTMSKTSKRNIVVRHLHMLFWILGLVVVCWLFFGFFSLSTSRTCENITQSKAESYFAINLPVNGRDGSLSYVQAKLIDVTWDLVIGQGVRAFQA